MHDLTNLDQITFPKGFLWGTAIAAHQNEGNNLYSDWYRWEQTHKDFPKSGLACDFYNRYPEDFKLAKEVLSNNAIRLSIEWARIEPTEGNFDETAIEHYRQIFKSARENGLSICLTLFHFTQPEWFASKGGFLNSDNIKYFERFALLMLENFKDEVDLWCTLNEPYTIVGAGYIQGMWPPGKKSLLKAIKVYLNFIRAHKRVYRLMKKNHPAAEVGVVIPMFDYHNFSPFKPIVHWIYDWIINRSFLDLSFNQFDFIGFNYYLAHNINVYRDLTHKVTNSDIRKIIENQGNKIGFMPYAEGIYNGLLELKRYQKPIFITENGISDPTDQIKPRFIIDHLSWVHQAIKEGVDVRGYFHWTLMDNFEWAFGFEPKFGLFEMHPQTLKRTPRQSAYLYGEISQTNSINSKIIRKYLDLV